MYSCAESTEDSTLSEDLSANKTNDILNETQPSIVKLDKSKISKLPYAIVQYAKESEKPLEALVHALNDFPKHAHILASMAIKSDLKREMVRNKEQGLETGLWLNRKPLDSQRLDIFSLFREMRAETSRLSALTELGLHGPEALDLISAPLVDAALKDYSWGEAFDLRSDKIIWWNNLEKDSRYRRYPKDLYSVFISNRC